jgi:diphthamide biosynthesis methyltransferase
MTESVRPTRKELLEHIKKELDESVRELHHSFLSQRQKACVTRLDRLNALLILVGDCLICQGDCPDGIPLDLVSYKNI